MPQTDFCSEGRNHGNRALEIIEVAHGAEAAAHYAGGLIAACRDVLVKHLGPRQAYEGMSSMADKIVHEFKADA